MHLHGYVNLMASLANPVISQEITDLVKDLLGPKYPVIHQLTIQQQRNDSDCWVFAIAFATCIVCQQDPSKVYFDIPRMRPHLLKCLKVFVMDHFPTVAS